MTGAIDADDVIYSTQSVTSDDENVTASATAAPVLAAPPPLAGRPVARLRRRTDGRTDGAFEYCSRAISHCDGLSRPRLGTLSLLPVPVPRLPLPASLAPSPALCVLSSPVPINHSDARPCRLSVRPFVRHLVLCCVC